MRMVISFCVCEVDVLCNNAKYFQTNIPDLDKQENTNMLGWLQQKIVVHIVIK